SLHLLQRHRPNRDLHSFPTRRSSDLEIGNFAGLFISPEGEALTEEAWKKHEFEWLPRPQDYAFVQSLMSGRVTEPGKFANWIARSEEHTSELQSRGHLVCRLLLEKKN